jgi:hypothetical protein
MEPEPSLYETLNGANAAIDEKAEEAVIEKAVARIDYARQKTVSALQTREGLLDL